MDRSARVEEVYQVVRQVPRGRVASYGLIGRSLALGRVSGLVVGGWLEKLPPHLTEEVPWWRIVGADGSLKTAKLGPETALRQKMKLESEGIEFEDGLIPRRCFLSADEWDALA